MSKFVSVTVTGLLSSGNGFLHCPHTAWSPAAIFSGGTRLFAPQAGQRINDVSAIFVLYLRRFRSISFSR
jgi:hypothetical protein